MMILFQRIDPALLTPSELQIWHSLTPPEFHCYFKGQTRLQVVGNSPYILAAMEDGNPIGVALATYFAYNKAAEIEYFFVLPIHRNKKIGTQLLIFLEKELLKGSCLAVTLVYPENEITRPFLEKMLQKLGWDKPFLFMIRCYYTLSEFYPPWYVRELEKKHAWNNRIQLFPWRELKLKERNALLHQQEQGRIPLEVSPFKDPGRLELSNSLGLRFEEEVIGWMVTHRLEPDLIRYSSFFIHKEYQFLGYSIALLCQSIFLQQQSTVPYAVVEVNVGKVHPSWMSFVKHRLIPYTTSTTRLRQAWHELTIG